MSDAKHDIMDTPAESSTVASLTPPKKRRNHRKAKKPFDGRFVLGRRVHALVEMFSERLGPDADDPIMGAAIRRAAEITALSERLRGRMLRGDPDVSADDALRTTRAADALTRRLHLDRRKPTSTPSLSSYLAARNGDTP
jgi:hypothetical protein